ncbi:MAG: acyloxyacyl hydrolase [Bacteroidales bacterium]|nr:acyloxyacyl hydrolase [Bacteroidales bacterium]
MKLFRFFRKSGFLWIILLGSFTAHPQPHSPKSKYNLSTELKLHYGFLWSHHLELDKFQAHYPAFELSLQQQSWGRHRWESEYAFPLIGISLWDSQLGGFEAIGTALAVYPFINFPLVKNRQQSLNFRLGVGLGYLSNRYDRLGNYKNFAIGSHLNVAGSLFFEYRRKWGKMASLSAGMGLTHFSNGAIKTPNYGLNILTANLGMSVFLGRPNREGSSKVLPELYPFEFDGRRYLEVNFAVAAGTIDMTQQLGERFMVFAFYTNLMKRVSYKSKLGIGLDLAYDASDKAILEWRGQAVENDWQILRPGANIAYELVLSRLSFLFNFGLHLAGKERKDGDMYQRLTLKFLLAENVFANIVLSSHFGKAEYIAFGLGYKLDFIYKRKIKH